MNYDEYTDAAYDEPDWSFVDLDVDYDEIRGPFEFRDEASRSATAHVYGEWREARYYAELREDRKLRDRLTLADVKRLGGFGKLTRRDLEVLLWLDSHWDVFEDDYDEDNDPVLAWQPNDPDCPPLMRRVLATTIDEDGVERWVGDPQQALPYFEAYGRLLHERNGLLWERLRRQGAGAVLELANSLLYAAAPPERPRRGTVAPVQRWARTVRTHLGQRRARRSSRPTPVRRRGSRRITVATSGGGDPPGSSDSDPPRVVALAGGAA